VKPPSPEVKEKLVAACKAYAEERIATAREAMENAQRAANAEEKSSAGDKYETGRAMMQRERDQAAMLLEESLKLLPMLERIKLEATSAGVTTGSIVMSKDVNFFIGISAGVLTVEDSNFIAVAPASPIAQQLLGKKAGDTFLFKKKSHHILWVG
jgi:transcription elongation GreA/GreB family factor